MIDDDGATGQDRKSYTDTQDRKTYEVDPDLDPTGSPAGGAAMATEPERWATCPWCRRTVPLGEAIDEGWSPEWWHGDVAHGPACPACAAKHLEEDGDGEMVLRPDHPLPEGEA